MAKLSFPSGHEVEVIFDDTAHSYVVAHKMADGEFTDYRPTHGITAPLAVVDRPYLTPWGSKEGVLATLEYVNNHPEVVEKLPQFFVDLEAFDEGYRNELNKPVMSYYRLNKLYPWYKDCKAAYKEKSKIGKELGTWLHESIENYYASGRKTLPVVTEECKGMWDCFLEFDDVYRPIADALDPATEQSGLEFLVYSLMFGYSGQGDFRGQIKGKHCILDWKSTNRSEFNKDGIDIDYFYQLGGLSQAEFERTGVWPDDIGIVNFDKKGGDPVIIFASEFGMSPQDAARAYISCFNNYHMQEAWDYKFKKR